MNIGEIIGRLEFYNGNSKATPSFATVNSSQIVIHKSLLRGHEYARLAYSEADKIIGITPCDSGAGGAVKASLPSKGTEVRRLQAQGLRKRWPGMPKGRLPVTVHGDVILIGTLPALDAEPTVAYELRGTTCGEIIGNLYDDGVAIGNEVARAIAARTNLSVTAVRTMADKIWTARQQKGLAGVKAEGRTAAQAARVEARANGAAE